MKKNIIYVLHHLHNAGSQRPAEFVAVEAEEAGGDL